METARQEEARRRYALIRTPRHSWIDYLLVNILNKPIYSPEVFEGDEYADNYEAGVLANAVQNLKHEMSQEMARLFNVTEPRLWDYANIAIPTFFYTTVNPKMELNTESDGLGWDRGLGALWLRYTIRKFFVALYRNKFRLDEPSNWRSILNSYESLRRATPASSCSLSHTRKHHCVETDMLTNRNERKCGPSTLSRTSIVVDYDNSSLSLWAEGPELTLMPWSTFAELGGHHQPISEGRMHEGTTCWDQAAERVGSLAESLTLSERDAVDLVFTGECWNNGNLATFKESMRVQGIKQMLNIVNEIRQADVFAASKRVARWGRHSLDTWDVCYMVSDDPGHDEL